jgi:precorrin-2 dehydrogenase / sirohydrochlorin ferrochelatase
MTRFYPVFLRLEGRACVVIGSGPVAEQKVAGLLRAGARVTVISPDPSRALMDLAADGVIQIRRRDYDPSDLDGAFLAIVHSDDPDVRRRAWLDAEQRMVLINAVDDMPRCTFIAPAIYEQGDLTVAVSTAGKSPALAVRVRTLVGDLLGPEYATLLDLMGDLRAEVALRVPDASARAALWYRIVDSEAIFESVRRGDLTGARAQIAQWVAQVESPAVDSTRARR